MQDHPGVTVIIPHFNGEELLRRCLLSLEKTRYPAMQILVVDNGSTDGSVSMVRSEFGRVHLVRSRTNLGFAAGCNLGIRASDTPFIALLNNDAEVTSGWLEPMVRCLKEYPRCAAVQPKVRSLDNRELFDYCGAAGGEIDIFGYPFARGRLFDAIEADEGQYDKPGRIFWATGAACLLRRSALTRVGLLDESFFAHMEEIDLNWRLQWAGYTIRFVPGAVVYHQTGGTLGQNDIRKMALNHRNNLLMLIKNVPAVTLAWLIPLRLILELITMAGSFLIGQPKRSMAVLWGMAGVPGKLSLTLGAKRRIMQNSVISEDEMSHRMYRGSAALRYFLGRVRTADQLMGISVK